jgi:hypothetical protein
MIILNWILKEQDVTVSRIGYSILMLWTRWWTVRLHKRGNFFTN